MNAHTRSTALSFALPLALSLTAGCGYNTIQTLDEKVNAAESQIKVQLQRRADLIPNLVETVKGYATQEQTIFIQVAEARAKLAALGQSGKRDTMAAEQSDPPGPHRRPLMHNRPTRTTPTR